jgi:hypothetical protein
LLLQHNTPIAGQGKPDRYKLHIPPHGLVTVTKYGSDPVFTCPDSWHPEPAERVWQLKPDDQVGRHWKAGDAR